MQELIATICSIILFIISFIVAIIKTVDKNKISKENITDKNFFELIIKDMIYFMKISEDNFDTAEKKKKFVLNNIVEKAKELKINVNIDTISNFIEYFISFTKQVNK